MGEWGAGTDPAHPTQLSNIPINSDERTNRAEMRQPASLLCYHPLGVAEGSDPSNSMPDTDTGPRANRQDSSKGSWSHTFLHAQHYSGAADQKGTETAEPED